MGFVQMAENKDIFSRIVSGEIPAEKVYEDDEVIAFLDINPVSDGHTLVVPKERFEKLDECPPEMLGRICSRLGKIAKAVVTAMDAEGYNVLCNNGRAAGQLINYVHFHIIPRNDGDGLLNRWPSYTYEKEKIEAIAEKIRQKL